MIETVLNVIEYRVIENPDDRTMKVSEFKSNYCFRMQILNVTEHRVTERMSEDSEYPLLETFSRVNASPYTGVLIGGMRDNEATGELPAACEITRHRGESERESLHDLR